MVGGAEQDFSDSLSLLKVLGKNIHHCGPVGSGQAVKLVNQILCGIHMVALSEAMRLAEIQEIDPSLIVEICSTGAAGSWALSNLGPKMIQSDYSAGLGVCNGKWRNFSTGKNYFISPLTLFCSPFLYAKTIDWVPFNSP